jgi:kynurenine formamidase
MPEWKPPTQAEVENYFTRLNNWGRWGADDQRGTLNLITPEKQAAAIALAHGGRVVSLARDITPQPTVDYHMLHPIRRGRSKAAVDYVGMVFHGVTVTHLDALCHVEYKGKVYNDRSFEESVRFGGATWGALDAWFDGVVTRGVLLDIASTREEGYVKIGKPVTPPELDAAAARAGVTVKSGDTVVIRSGREAHDAAGVSTASLLDERPGLHISCLEWLREHDVACLAWDMLDERPVGYNGFDFGVHLGIPLLGLCLIDNVNPERLVTACAEEQRYEFLFIALPLRVPGSTGSPCQPVAIF